jgi:hypothetical protein
MRRPKLRADSFEILIQQDLSFGVAALANVDVREAGERFDGVSVVWAEDFLFAGPERAGRGVRLEGSRGVEAAVARGFSSR